MYMYIVCPYTLLIIFCDVKVMTNFYAVKEALHMYMNNFLFFSMFSLFSSCVPSFILLVKNSFSNSQPREAIVCLSSGQLQENLYYSELLHSLLEDKITAGVY